MLFLTFLLSSGFFFSSGAIAQNGAKDIHFRKQEDRIKLVFKLETMPEYSVILGSSNELIFTLLNVSQSPLFIKRMKDLEDIVLVKEGNEKQGLEFRISLQKPVREVESKWIVDQGLLCIDFIFNKYGKTQKSVESESLTLNDIRFGVKEPSTRLVLGFNGKPLWQIRYLKNRQRSIRFENVTTTLKKKKYGPFKRLEAVTVVKEQHSLNVNILPGARVVDERIFWLEVGNRLVMDFYDIAEKEVEKDLLLPSDFGKEETFEDSRAALPLDSKKKIEKPELELAAYRPGEGPFVRIPLKPPTKVDKKDPEIPNEEIKKERPIQKNINEPENTQQLQLLTNEKKTEEYKLAPDEASLYGKILQAKDLNKFEKGINLINLFISKYPNSPALEKLFFEKADFMFSVFKKGRKDLLPEVASSFQEAIGRFGTSEKVPWAYIKLAQVNRLGGSAYVAIGYLNLVTDSFKDSTYLPQAYVERAKVHLARRSPDLAMEDYGVVINKFPSSEFAPEARFGIAQYLQSKGLYEQVEKTLLEIDKSSPGFLHNHPNYFSFRGRNCLYLKKYDQARSLFFRALNIGQQSESDDLLWAHIGDTYLQSSKEKEAKKIFDFVINEYPDSEGASIAQLRLGEAGSELDVFQKVHEKNLHKPIGDIAMLKMANAYYRRGQYNKTMETLKNQMKSTLSSEIGLAARELFAKAAQMEFKNLFKEKNYSEAVQFYRSNEETFYGRVDPGVQLKYAQSFFFLERYSEAINSYRNIKPEDLNMEMKGDYYKGLAKSLIGNGYYDRAIGFLERNLKKEILEKDKQEMILVLADVYKEKPKLEQAYNLYSKLTKSKRLLPRSTIARAYFHMGEILNLESKNEKARDALNRCIALVEKDESQKDQLLLAAAEIGASYFMEKRYVEAVGAIQEALDAGFGPNKATYWNLRLMHAESYLGLGNSEKAESILKEISDEGDPELQPKVQVKLGSIKLQKELSKLSIYSQKSEK